jgi:UDP-N-acetylmuramoylalanine--D-glutamate ligase
MTGASDRSGTTVVMGFGVTGRAVARYMTGNGRRVVVAEDRPSAAMRKDAAELGVTLVESPDPAELGRLLGEAGQLVPSPGVPVEHPVYDLARAAGVAIRSEIELGWQRLAGRGPAAPALVAVTGTNGKTTVTTLVTEMLSRSGRSTVAAGNIGTPLIEAAGADVDVVVAEVSSFQLQFTEGFHPAVATWLNLSADHLDWHPTLEHYAEAKARIWAAQGPGDVAVLNGDDAGVMAAASATGHGVPAGVTRLTFSLKGPSDYGVRDGILVGPGGLDIVSLDGLWRRYPHDIANSLAAAATALAAGGDLEGCRSVLSSFRTLPHRMEWIGEAGGVQWVDDSKATTPASVVAAVAGFDSVVLIAGGRNKGLDLSVLAGTAPPVRAVVAMGEASAEVEAAFAGAAPVTVAEGMAEAVALAAALAAPGDAVLLSPGCASFDLYPGYAARGEHFAGLVRELLARERPVRERTTGDGPAADGEPQ